MRWWAVTGVLVAVMGLLSAGCAQGQAPDSAATDDAWLVLPYAAYAPETKLSGGLVVGWYAPPQGGYASNVQGLVTVTQRRQVIVQVQPDVYLRGGRWRVLGEVQGSYFPDTFYGVGGDTPTSFATDYTSTEALLDVAVQRRITAGWHAGPRLLSRYERITALEELPPGQAALAGRERSWVLGLGGVFTRDRRDNRYFPRRGSFAEASLLGVTRLLAGGRVFAQSRIDLRAYRPWGPGIAAAQLYGEATMGQPPFSLLPQLGGPDVLRGYREGRFRDRVYWAAQAAYRLPLFWRFKAVAFGSVGEVAGGLTPDLVGDLAFAAGGGGRLRLTDGGVHGRIDLAYGSGGWQLYLSMLEAF